MANIIESRVTLEDEVFEETIDTMEEPIEVVRPSSYNDLEDLPQVNGVTLMGNKTSEELGIVTATDIENAVSAEATLRENADTALGGRIDGEKTARENADTALGGRIDTEITNRTDADNALGTRVDNEILARQGGDNNLQTQIDAITSKSDVVDVVADYAALQAYDTQHLGNNDVIKVLDDETHNDAQTYYRWNKTAGTWSYIGSEAPYYSKGQIDQQMQAKQDKLTAGTGISLDGATISADTTVLATKDDLEPEIVADLPAVGDTTKLYLTPTNKTASGNPITIDLKEDVGQITSFRLDGDTYQQSYTGKNLFDIATASDVWIKDTGTSQPNDVWKNSDFIKVEPNTTYTLSGSTIEGGFKQFQYHEYSSNNESSYINQYAQINWVNSITFTTHTGCNFIRVGYRKDALKNIQLELGSTATSYEPYVGGVPSPNPDYPQQIQTVTGEQTVTIVGKNLIDPDGLELGNIDVSGNDSASQQVVRSGYIRVAAGSYTLKVNNSENNINLWRYAIYDNSKTFISANTPQAKSAAITIANNGYIRVSFYNVPWKDLTVQEIIGSQVQLELGSTASSYTPYSKQTLPLDLGSIELCKLGTYQDYIYKDGSDWKVHKATGKITLNGSEAWYNAGGNAPFGLVIDGALITTSDANPPLVYCDKFYPVSQDSSWSSYNSLISTNNINSSTKTIRIRYTGMAGLSAFQTWLGNNNTALYYALATPTDTTITDTALIAQLEAVRTASLENGANTITNTATGANLAGSMSIGYYGYNPSEYSEWRYVDGAWEQVGGRPIPTKTSDLENDSDYATRDEVATKLQTVIVDELPTMGDEGKLYLTPKNYTTGTASGNPITITLGEDAGQITSAQLYGDTYQQSYTGKNLFDIDSIITGYELISATGEVRANADWWVTPLIPVEAGEAYTSSNMRVFNKAFYAENGDFVSTISTQTATAPTGARYVRMNAKLTDIPNYTGKAQLEKGSTASSYEPYVGGVPSPNPDYPQPIQTVTGRQMVKVEGKNIYNKDLPLSKTYYTNTGAAATYSKDQFINFTIVPTSDKITMSYSGIHNQQQGSAILAYVRLVQYDSNGQFISRLMSNTNNYTFDISSSVAKIIVCIDAGEDAYFDDLQLEYGNQATDYLPYQSGEYEINLNCNIYDKDLAYMSGNDMLIPIDITPGSSYHYGATTRWVGAYLYDASGTLVRTVGHTGATRSGNFTAAPNEVKAVFTFYAGPDVTWDWSGVEFYDLAGVIELCKIGDYQDYIYKDGGDWKVHKAVAKHTLTPNEGWLIPNSASYPNLFQTNAISDLGNLSDAYTTASTSPQAYCEALVYLPGSADVRTTQGFSLYHKVEGGTAYNIARINIADFTTTTQLNNWLSTCNASFWYGVKNPTDTTITDTNLIAQLEAVRNATLQASNTITNTATGTNLAGDLELGYCEYDPTNRYDKWLWLDLNNNYEKLGS